MAPLLYLITPADPDPVQFPRLLMAALTGPEIAAMLVRRGTLDDAAYASLAERLIQIGQAAGAAVLLEDDVALVRRLGADGVHVTGGAKAISEAIAALKPAAIVGAGNIRSRHDAMSFGELDVDYVMFGPLGGAADKQAAELAQWWAHTFEVPAVYSDPAANIALLADLETEFIALSDCIWSDADPAAALGDFDRAAREEA
ncbi:thiamine phosphate synthase [Devosia sp. YIM 151766]|uniref:thiamine phosphate synthase n=1 Tax=Devosia sp. YIM 151766 TaxID=3017325 RepID=UPI00255C48A1|nr:thiamine phosphate synthase [Devosia sp. YIM 151766]WIY52204.1 thiamine phosphate synthase [Devosia sp. YIM 151766]